MLYVFGLSITDAHAHLANCNIVHRDYMVDQISYIWSFLSIRFNYTMKWQAVSRSTIHFWTLWAKGHSTQASNFTFINNMKVWKCAANQDSVLLVTLGYINLTYIYVGRYLNAILKYVNENFFAFATTLSDCKTLEFILGGNIIHRRLPNLAPNSQSKVKAALRSDCINF